MIDHLAEGRDIEEVEGKREVGRKVGPTTTPRPAPWDLLCNSVMQARLQEGKVGSNPLYNPLLSS